MKREQCGTRRGYNIHCAQKEVTCAACRKAHASYHLTWSSRQPKKPPKPRKTKEPRVFSVEEVAAAKDRKRRALKLAAPSEPYTTQDILDLWGSNCYLCGEPIDLEAPRKTGAEGWERGLHLEHVVALSNGGSDLRKNIRPSHGLCNLQKAAA